MCGGVIPRLVFRQTASTHTLLWLIDDGQHFDSLMMDSILTQNNPHLILSFTRMRPALFERLTLWLSYLPHMRETTRTRVMCEETLCHLLHVIGHRHHVARVAFQFQLGRATVHNHVVRVASQTFIFKTTSFLWYNKCTRRSSDWLNFSRGGRALRCCASAVTTNNVIQRLVTLDLVRALRACAILFTRVVRPMTRTTHPYIIEPQTLGETKLQIICGKHIWHTCATLVARIPYYEELDVFVLKYNRQLVNVTLERNRDGDKITMVQNKLG